MQSPRDFTLDSRETLWLIVYVSVYVIESAFEAVTVDE